MYFPFYTIINNVIFETVYYYEYFLDYNMQKGDILDMKNDTDINLNKQITVKENFFILIRSS